MSIGVVVFVVWIALQGRLTVANVVGGLIVAVGVVVLFPSTGGAAHRVNPVALVRFVGRLLVDLVRSSATVVIAVLRPDPARVRTEVIEVRLATRSRLVTTVVGNAITLTPGTMTLDVRHDDDGYVLDVHVLGTVDHTEFAASIAGLESRVARAFRLVGDAAPPAPPAPPESGSEVMR
ncbi:MAG: Na+/H+ antiporter subunit E [Acidimicrobiales bacterium]|nr:Na+/H+ antiporter subunit E [Acidimicrobiales bacterium]MCB9392093.1 Na+/H+ antiporter subunit E [Acidimicrobiaceae bacterium]